MGIDGQNMYTLRMYQTEFFTRNFSLESAELTSDTKGIRQAIALFSDEKMLTRKGILKMNESVNRSLMILGQLFVISFRSTEIPHRSGSIRSSECLG